MFKSKRKTDVHFIHLLFLLHLGQTKVTLIPSIRRYFLAQLLPRGLARQSHVINLFYFFLTTCLVKTVKILALLITTQLNQQWNLLILLISALEALIYVQLTRIFLHWYLRDNVNEESIFAFLGHIYEYLQVVCKKRTFMDLHLAKFEQRRYESRFLGMFHFSTPILTIRDPELIQQMLVKDMDSFAARHCFMPSGLDSFWDANIFVLEEARWRSMRSKLSPIFTREKMKRMFPVMMQTAQQYVAFLSDNDMMDLNTKSVFRRYGTDVITNVMLGISSDSIRNEGNDFCRNGSKLSNNNGFLRALTLNLAQFSSKLGAVFNVKGFDPAASEFFLKLVQEQITLREKSEEKIERNDLLDLLMKARAKEEKETTEPEDLKKHNNHNCKEDIDTGYATAQEVPHGEIEKDRLDYQNITKSPMTDVDIAAQIMFFFTSSHDTVSTALSFLCYELSRHNGIQETLRREIDATKAHFLDITEVSYEAICEMEYLDQVVCESLRKWPPALFTDRKAVNHYHIPRTLNSMETYPYESDVILEPGDVIVVPIFAIHRSAQHFKHPKVFDPSRFDKQNRRKIKPYTYMPFGVGGRNCIGSRFALMQIKVVIFHLLAKYRLHLTRKTSLNLSKGLCNLDSEGGIWLGLEKRTY